jgi:Protein of unknown function (DUF2975)
MTTRREPDPFAPVDGAVTILLNFVLVLLAITAVLAMVNLVRDGSSGLSFATIGEDRACAVVRNETVPAVTDVPQRGIRRDVASMHVEQVEVCLTDPTFWQRAASALEPVGSMVFGLGSLVLTRRTIRRARRGGLFTPEAARATRQLGWFLLVMTALWPFVAAAGRGVVVAAAVPGQSWAGQLIPPGGSIALVVVSFGVLTFARILRRAVPLQEEVDATV